MTCQDAQELFSAWVDGALTSEERMAWDAHLGTCPDCPRELERFQKTVALLRAAEPARAPVGFVNRVVGAAHPMSWHRRLVRRLLTPIPIALPIQVAAVLVVALTAVYLWERAPELQDLRPAARPRESVPPARDLFRSAEPSSAPAEERAAAPEAVAEAPPTRGGRPDSPPAPRLRAEGRTESSASVATRPEEPASERERSADAVEEKTGATTGAKKSAAAGVAGRREAPAARPADVAGQLTVDDRVAAARGLADLLARVGATEVSRRAGLDTPPTEIVEIEVPRAAYPALLDGLGRLGRWVPEREPAELPGEVRVSLRITE